MAEVPKRLHVLKLLTNHLSAVYGIDPNGNPKIYRRHVHRFFKRR